MKNNRYNVGKESLTVKIVGAGPGSADLLTLRAFNAIKNAKVILYDALIGEDILEYASPETKLIYVGKRAANHSYSQEEINKLIVDYAYNYGNVVRLKGGDPYIFGRGHEEYEYVASFDIDVEVIPGISSALSVPALSHIPLTKRGVSESFWVLTATNKKGELSKDIQAAVKTDATIVILMGVGKLDKVVKLFQQNNKGNVPVAIIQNGSLKSSKMVVANVDTIIDKAAKEKVGTPGIIVIGEVVSTQPNFLLEQSEVLLDRYKTV